jgi:PEP-CTERM motif
MTFIRRAALGTTLAIGLAMAGPAEAATFTLIGGTAGTIQTSATTPNDFIGTYFPGPQIGGFFGSQISFDSSLATAVLFEFFGAEAGYHNEFNLGSSELFDHPGGTVMASGLGAPLATFLATLAGSGSGMLPISFDVNLNGTSIAVLNGSNPNDIGGAAIGPDFFASCNPFGSTAGAGGTTCNALYLFLDDGRGSDVDHDDFLVRVTAITPLSAPEPATLGLLGAGLLFVARSLRRKA